MDKLDIQILGILQENARAKNVDIARDLGIAQSTVLERIRRLENQGAIRSYRAVIEPEKLGLNVRAFVSVSMQRNDAESIRKFERGVERLHGVRACYHVTGRFDYLLHVVVKDLKDLGNLVKNEIGRLNVYAKSETFVIFSDIKPDKGIPINLNGDPMESK